LFLALTGLQNGLKDDCERNLKPEVAATTASSPDEVWVSAVVAYLRKRGEMP